MAGKVALIAEQRQCLTEIARDGLAAHRVARWANALILLDRGMSCRQVAKVLLVNDDTVRDWHATFTARGMDQLPGFDYSGWVAF